jgi:ArsR family transcriptional regulator, arsenate/arsenite/antimonite-responsive transcriptional repressor
MSAHLSILTRAGLVSSQRHSRSIVYRANLDRFQSVALFLVKDCCGGRPEVCAPLIERLSPSSTQKKKGKANVRARV